MIDFEKMSDSEINKAVEKEMGVYAEDFDGRYIKTCDYVNNIADAWPIITTNKIDIIQDQGGDMALAMDMGVNMILGDEGISCQDENPIRAAMIVFLMMRADGL